MKAQILGSIVAVALLSACATTPASSASPHSATATLAPKSGSQAAGTAHFSQKEGKVTLTVQVKGLSPGVHAVHLHENGDCSSPDAKSAGPHWNPGDHSHGEFNKGDFHLGDIGNLEVNEKGEGALTLTTDKWSVGTGHSNDVVGHAMVVHADEDDFASQPAGNAGSRIACGVVAN